MANVAETESQQNGNPEVTAVMVNAKEGNQVIDILSKGKLKSPFLLLTTKTWGYFQKPVARETGIYCYRLNHFVKVKEGDTLVIRTNTDNPNSYYNTTVTIPAFERDATDPVDLSVAEPELKKNIRGEQVLAAAQACAGKSVGSGDCYAFVGHVTSGHFGTPIGTYSSGRTFRLLPGHVLHMRGFNFGNMYGANHYAIVETVHEDGTITILHQNMGGATWVVRNRIRPSTMSGSMQVYQP